MIGDALALGALPRHVAGLRGGNATVHEDGSFRLNSYQYVKGVVVSGTVDANRNAKRHDPWRRRGEAARCGSAHRAR